MQGRQKCKVAKNARLSKCKGQYPSYCMLEEGPDQAEKWHENWSMHVPEATFPLFVRCLIAVDYSNIFTLQEGILVAFHYSFSFYSDSTDMHTDHIFMFDFVRCFGPSMYTHLKGNPLLSACQISWQTVQHTSINHKWDDPPNTKCARSSSH